ncbi:hypothetical protein ACFLS1_08120 [Verrucomicrobiota bacterium]
MHAKPSVFIVRAQRPACLFVCILFCLLFPLSSFAERYYVVQVTDRTGRNSFSALSDEEYKSLQNEIRAESRIFPKAIRAAQKEWKENPETSKTTFPASSFKTRKIKSLGMFFSQEKAEAKLAYYATPENTSESSEKGTRLLERQLKDEKERLNNLNSAIYEIKSSCEANIAALEEQLKKRREKNKKREETLNAAKELLEEKLEELKPQEEEAERPTSNIEH